ncbi:class I SAM-dependent methyltransferase [Microbulbifer hydrolyticus]|uniref:O-methyltransferase YrrM n=1 Tax=Microbulbifer hydrolyticus TaxID=48074 RepID=A0A6P1TD82_9GAMM|nr:class I SAM-dependent methyltransferase [Microbulbifer hydrolyticus]MBB5212310.1 putative O-methyltransferase YrrM [Microbulbifer hydrolyticus]QHQ39957.1 hypothetical protein GTQ55_13830 [Microbulbifer hydrolyticus]
MEVKDGNEELKNLIIQLKAQIEQERTERKDLECKITRLFSESLDAQRQDAKAFKHSIESAIQRSVANSVKQIEAFIGIQDFFQTGEPALNFHGWPISSDVAQYLVEVVSTERPDLVLEFGSGTSTVLFAKAMKALADSRNRGAGENQKECSPKVITFEHHDDYLKKTADILASHGVQAFVDLVHAPLVEQTVDSESYIFYDCSQKLFEMAALDKGIKQKVVVLIDGPPGATCDNARYPALPVLLDYMAGHEIFVILDDYDRPEEHEIVEKWKALLDKREIPYSFQRLPFEKGAALLKIN